ncbi:hypothetical protein [Polynucleobacter tropicus]|uniref:hypothetical protein n=1 Tax=Polynucleobacter tropicus TaxID=1743174 RepID=UPI00156F4716|nr:hypothetical protein [Polynucleobacter tropicus]
MHKILAILSGLLLSIPAYSAGLGFNPFERSSPTSATGAAKPSPASPAPAATPAPKAAPSPVAPAKQDAQTQKSSNTPNKK